eukprot:COSAG02_NODE_2066_length_9960_cov_3.087009_2_plen_131_part_00
MLAQYELRTVTEEERDSGRGFLHQVTDEELPRQFVKAYPRMGLHVCAGGLGLRQWRFYVSAAFVGMWAHAWQSSMVPMIKGSKVVMPAFPALERVIVDAERVRSGESDGSETVLARALAAAFAECKAVPR